MKWKNYRLPAWVGRVLPLRQSVNSTLERNRRHRAHSAAASNNLTFSWSTEEKTADQVVYEDLAALRARSRGLVRDNDHARKFVDMNANNVVGPLGVKMQGQVLNAKDQPDREANETLERHFRTWGRRGGCDVTGRLSWVDVQILAWRGMIADGEAIIRKVRGHGQYGFQLQLIDPMLLDVTYNAELVSGNRIRMGIEIDKWGKPVAYHISKFGANSVHGFDNRKLFDRVPAADIIHLFRPESAGQSRGLPRMATAMLRLEMIGKYEEAALVNAREGASNMMLISANDGGETMPADATAADGSLLQDIEPGTTRILPPGYSVEPYDPTYPNGEIAEFVKLMLQGASSGLGVDYVGLSGNLEGVNYSSIRAGVLETREVWKESQRFFIDSFCRPIFEAWLYESLMNQALTGSAGGRSLMMRDYDKLVAVTWQGKRWAWVDPVKDQSANQIALDMGATSLSDIIAETGKDPAEVWQQIGKDNDTLAALGIEFPGSQEEGSDNEEDD